MDDADRASLTAEDERARSLSAQLARLRCRQPGSPFCASCGEEIAKERREALPNCFTCVECQDRIERGMGR
jgi:phage/conjugal plasmid C-4 type zinc finger TraR family protein